MRPSTNKQWVARPVESKVLYIVQEKVGQEVDIVVVIHLLGSSRFLDGTKSRKNKQTHNFYKSMLVCFFLALTSWHESN